MAIIVNSIFGILAIVAVVLCIESVYRQRKKNQLKKESICKKIPNAADGYYLLRGQGIMEYLYIENKMYSIVFSQTTPYKIVFVRELGDKEIMNIERQCESKNIKERINKSNL
jgi:hypothetical protein